MNNLLKAELYKFKKNIYFWTILGIMVLCYLPSLFASTATSIVSLLKNIEKDVMVTLIAIAIYSGLTISNDFSNRTIIHYISSGHKRSHIILAEYLNFIFTSMLIIILYPTIMMIISSIILSLPLIPNIDILLYSVLKSIILYSGIISIFFLVSILTKKGAASMGISITISILAVVLSNKLYSDSSSFGRLNPLIQIQYNNNFSLDLFLACIISLSLVSIVIIISVLMFNKAEIR